MNNTIPPEIKKWIEDEAEKYNPVYASQFTAGATSLYQHLQENGRVVELEKEVERLKGLIEKAFNEGEKHNEDKKKPSFSGFLDGYTGNYGFKKFAKENNL